MRVTFLVKPFTIFLLLFYAFSVYAVGGQFWDKKPPNAFDKNTLIQVNCADYKSSIEAVIGLNDFTLSVGGNYATLCGTPFNLYSALEESFVTPKAGTAVTLCLSDGHVSGLDCMANNDSSLVTTVFSESFFSFLSDPNLIQKRQQEEDLRGAIADLNAKSIPSAQLDVHLDSIQKTSTQLNIRISGDSSRLLEQLGDKVVESKPVEIKVTESKKIESETIETKKAAVVERFLNALARGSSGDDIRRLQEFLAGDKELYPEGLVTGYFGQLTELAVQRFQARHNIVSSGDPVSTGYGRVGPRTLRKLNELTGAP